MLARNAAARELAVALLCASGGTRPPKGERLAALMERLRSGTVGTATLAGARVLADGDAVVIGREPGRAGLPAVQVRKGESVVWDGRFEVASEEAGVVRALAGSAGRLSKPEAAALKAVPAPFRPTLPVVETASGAVSCPLFTMPAQARSLAGERRRAACGAFTREQDIPGQDGEWRGPCRRPISVP